MGKVVICVEQAGGMLHMPSSLTAFLSNDTFYSNPLCYSVHGQVNVHKQHASTAKPS